MLVRFAALGAITLGLVALPLAAVAASSSPPVDLGGAYVVDETGALDGREAEIEAALDALFEKTGTGLYVVVVDRFEGASDDQAWVDESATLSGLGDADVLLGIAVDDRSYRLSVADAEPSGTDFEAVATEHLVPALRDDEFADGIIAYATALGGGGGIPILPIVGGVAAAGVGAFVVTRIVRRRRGEAPGPGGQPSQTQLDARAGSLLVALDDAVRDSEQELGFAEAQFGAKATAEFRTALDAARTQLAAAFAIRQRLDDSEPETAEQKRSLSLELIELCESADASLDAQAEGFAQLRALETNAAEVLQKVAAAHSALPAAIERAATTIATLRTSYGAAALAAVDGAAEQARPLVAFAATALDEARAAVARDDSSAAALAVRGAQQAVDQAEALVASVTALEAELPRTVASLRAAIDDTRADLVEARAVPTTGAGAADRPALTAAIGEAERAIAEAEKRDPASALTAVNAANAALATTLASVRDRQAQASRAAEQLARVQASALDRVTAAQSFIATRRGAIGTEARTRVAEAERHLAEARALQTSDPVAALAAAQQAEQLASAALELARSEVSASRRSAPEIGGIVRGGTPRGGFGGATGAVIAGAAAGRAARSGAPRTSTPSSRSQSSSSSSRRSGRRGGGGRF